MFQGTPVIATKKFSDNKNYLNWYASGELWFLGQCLPDRLTKKVLEIDAAIKNDWESFDYELSSFLWHSIEPKFMAHLRPYRRCYEVS